MNATRIIVALALLIGATTATLAQSQRNYGPNTHHRDSFGQPYSGAQGNGHR